MRAFGAVKGAMNVHPKFEIQTPDLITKRLVGHGKEKRMFNILEKILGFWSHDATANTTDAEILEVE